MTGNIPECPSCTSIDTVVEIATVCPDHHQVGDYYCESCVFNFEAVKFDNGWAYPATQLID